MTGFFSFGIITIHTKVKYAVSVGFIFLSVLDNGDIDIIATDLVGNTVRAGRKGDNMKNAELKKATLGRVPLYLGYLDTVAGEAEYVSSSEIARALGLGEVQVRKDLGALSGKGRPKIGYDKEELKKNLKSYIENDGGSRVILVGAGRLGRAILGYGGFGKFGLAISAAFDSDPDKTGLTDGGKKIFPIEKLSEYCKKNDVKIGIVTVPVGAAQRVCDLLVESGVKVIWNFAPTKLKVGEGVIVQQEDMALSLAYLSFKTENL